MYGLTPELIGIKLSFEGYAPIRNFDVNTVLRKCNFLGRDDEKYWTDLKLERNISNSIFCCPTAGRC